MYTLRFVVTGFRPRDLPGLDLPFLVLNSARTSIEDEILIDVKDGHTVHDIKGICGRLHAAYEELGAIGVNVVYTGVQHDESN